MKIIPQALQCSAGDVSQCLAWCHQVEIPVGLQSEEIHHLGDHFPVLTRQHNSGRYGLTCLKRADHGSEFDRLRTRP
jgi:hypothetical protein